MNKKVLVYRNDQGLELRIKIQEDNFKLMNVYSAQTARNIRFGAKMVIRKTNQTKKKRKNRKKLMKTTSELKYRKNKHR